MSFRQLLITASLALCPLLLLADEWTAGGRKENGYFQSYSNSVLMLRSSRGRLLKEQATRITKLTFGKPIKVTYVTLDQKEPQEGMLNGYERSNFLFEKDGKPVLVGYMKVRSLERLPDPESNDDSGGGIIAAIDIASLEQFYEGKEMAAAQKTALSAYKSARGKYDTYINQSSAIVSQMNSASGMQRENLMDQLRKRKFEEQPIKNAMLDAQADLLDAFPEITGKAVPTAPAVATGAAPAGGSENVKQVSTPPIPEPPKTSPVAIPVQQVNKAPAQAPIQTPPVVPAVTNKIPPSANAGTGTVKQGDTPPDIEW